jgi:hypothetical protein
MSDSGPLRIPGVQIDTATPGQPVEVDTVDAYWRDITRTTSVVRESRVRRPHLSNPAYGDPKWRLDLMSSNPARASITIYFKPVPNQPGRYKASVPPDGWTEVSKRYAYLLINEPAPKQYTQRDRSTAVKWIANSTIKLAVNDLYPLFWWLNERGVIHAADVSTTTLSAYRKHVLGLDVKAGRHFQLLSAVERFVYAAPMLLEDDRLAQPSWTASDVVRPGATPVPGSAREVHDPALFGPLLSVAEGMVRVMALDIFSAQQRVRESPQGQLITNHAEAERVLMGYADQGGIPAIRYGDGLRLDRVALVALHGIAGDTLSQVLNKRGLKGQLNLNRAVRVPTPVRGLIADQPWCDGVPWSEAAYDGGRSLLLHLQAACFVVLAYYSGARPEELRALPIDCLVVIPPRRDGGPILNLIEGRKFKQQRDEDDAANDDGVTARWTTIGPGVDAARVAAEVARRLFNDPTHLFPSEDGTGAVAHKTMEDRVERLITWINATGEREGWPTAYRVPTARVDRLRGLAGFRRTVGPFQRDQNDGAEVLRQQYQHASEVMGDGYASTAQKGYTKLLTRERREEHERLMRQVANDLVAGAGVSGPAARRLIAAAAEEEPLRAVFLGEREARDVADEHRTEGLPVHDNPNAYSLCVFDLRTAKCLDPDIGPDDDPALVPDRGACQEDCGNHARTDRQVADLQAEVDRHRREAASPLINEPMATRRRAVADRLQRDVDQHERARIFIALTDVTDARRAEAGRADMQGE